MRPQIWPSGDVEREILQRDDAAKAHGHVVHLENGHL
jgi:hypothetical protein